MVDLTCAFYQLKHMLVTISTYHWIAIKKNNKSVLQLVMLTIVSKLHVHAYTCTCTCIINYNVHVHWFTMYPTTMINYSCCIAGQWAWASTFQLILILKVWHFSVDGTCIYINWYCSYKMTRDLLSCRTYIWQYMTIHVSFHCTSKHIYCLFLQIWSTRLFRSLWR